MCGSLVSSPPARFRTSPPSMLTAATCTTTPPGCKGGSSTSAYRSTSGGPFLSYTAAFIAPPRCFCRYRRHRYVSPVPTERSLGLPFRWALLGEGASTLSRVVGRRGDLAHRFTKPDGFELREVTRPSRHLLDRPLGERRACKQSLRQCVRLGHQVVMRHDPSG